MASLCAVPWGVSVRGLVIRGLTDSRLSRVTPLTSGVVPFAGGSGTLQHLKKRGAAMGRGGLSPWIY